MGPSNKYFFATTKYMLENSGAAVIEKVKNINSAYCASVQRDKAVVVAQLVDQGVLTPEVRGSNPAISKICTEQLYTVKTLLKRRKLKKEARNQCDQ